MSSLDISRFYGKSREKKRVKVEFISPLMLKVSLNPQRSDRGPFSRLMNDWHYKISKELSCLMHNENKKLNKKTLIVMVYYSLDVDRLKKESFCLS